MVMIAAMLALAPVGAGQAPSPPPADGKCASAETGAIVVCGSGPPPYRIDPDVTAGVRAAERDRADATAPVPAAQTACTRSPMGCGKGLEGLDLANVAVVAGTMAVKAARGHDWARPLRPAGPGEFQRYREAKQLREERAAVRAARRLRDAARAAAEQ